jgi:hypothetical protein
VGCVRCGVGVVERGARDTRWEDDVRGADGVHGRGVVALISKRRVLLVPNVFSRRRHPLVRTHVRLFVQRFEVCWGDAPEIWGYDTPHRVQPRRVFRGDPAARSAGTGARLFAPKTSPTTPPPQRPLTFLLVVSKRNVKEISKSRYLFHFFGDGQMFFCFPPSAPTTTVVHHPPPPKRTTAVYLFNISTPSQLETPTAPTDLHRVNCPVRHNAARYAG